MSRMSRTSTGKARLTAEAMDTAAIAVGVADARVVEVVAGADAVGATAAVAVAVDGMAVVMVDTAAVAGTGTNFKSADLRGRTRIGK